MKTSCVISCILLGFVAFEPISAVEQTSYNATTCVEQEPCIKFTGHNLHDLEEASVCDDKSCGQYTVCIQLDFESLECLKPWKDKFAYTCAHNYSNDFGPKRYPEVCNPAKGGLTSKKTGGAWIKNDAEFCQTVAPGESAVFVFKDGNGECLDSGEYASSGTSGITCKQSEEEYCQADRTGKECVWTVPTPACISDQTKPPTSSPKSPPALTPTETPTASPMTEAPTATRTSAPASVSGDPHFKTWAGEHYDFHGVCDLVLLKNHEFKSGLGMDIHIRTKKIRQWSYISNAVVRIGENLFELGGDPSVENGFKYWANTLEGADIPVHDKHMVLPTTLSGYPITYRRVNLKQHEFIIDLGNHEDIVLKKWKELVRVDINGATSANFGESSGLMGAFEDGARLSRDKNSTLGDNDEFGLEWQVRATEPMLFHEIDGPQAPEKCLLPSTSSLRKQLGESLISQKEAEAACSGVQSSSSDFILCVFDVMATNDVGVAGAYLVLLK